MDIIERMNLEKQKMAVSAQMVTSACLAGNLSLLRIYKSWGVDFNSIYDSHGDTLLHLAIRSNQREIFAALIDWGCNIETPSRYDGTTALNYAAMTNKPQFVNQLIALGADLNSRDYHGYTPLNNALDHYHYDVASMLLKLPTLDVNIPSEEGILPVYIAYVDGRIDTLDVIITHPTYDSVFNQIVFADGYIFYDFQDYLSNATTLSPAEASIWDAYLEAKIFGLKYDFDGCIPLTHLNYHQFDCFSFEGYAPRWGAMAIYDSYQLFYNTIIAQSHIPSWALQAFVNVNESLHFCATVFDPLSYYNQIIIGNSVIIPSGWDAHSIVFVIHDDKLYRCNRGMMSDGVHGIEEFIIHNLANLTPNLIGDMLLAQGSPQFLQYDLISILDLEKIGEIENSTQLVGNCTWTSLEAGLEASLLTNFIYQGVDSETAHILAKDCYTVWETFDLSYTLMGAIEHQENLIQNEIYDDLLIKVLENHHNPYDEMDVQRAVVVLNELDKVDVFETFDLAIGQNVIHYFPQSYQEISYMKDYAPSYTEYVTSWFYSPPTSNNHNVEDQIMAQEYYEFLKVCDAYQQKIAPSVINLSDILQMSNDPIEQFFENSLSTQVLLWTPMEVLTQPVTLEHFA